MFTTKDTKFTKKALGLRKKLNIKGKPYLPPSSPMAPSKAKAKILG